MYHVRQNIDIWRGAIAACLFPILLGLCMFIVMISSVNAKEYWLTLPVILCFIFGTPIAAWLACRTLRKAKYPEHVSDWGLSCLTGFRGATIIHFWAALIHTIGNMLFSPNSVPAFMGFTEFIPNLLLIIVLHLLIWVIVTLPLSFLCGTIFWAVTATSNWRRAL